MGRRRGERKVVLRPRWPLWCRLSHWERGGEGVGREEEGWSKGRRRGTEKGQEDWLEEESDIWIDRREKAKEVQGRGRRLGRGS